MSRPSDFTLIATITQPCGLLIPLYTKPTDPSWAALAVFKKSSKVPIIVVIDGGNSGPGTVKEPSYVTGIASLQAAGITVLGYVYSSYATRPIAQVQADIADWDAFYGIQSIFVDNMFNDAGQEPYYRQVASSIRGFSVGNPGTTVSPTYQGIFDVLNVYEGAGVPVAGDLTPYPRSTTSYLAHTVATFPTDILQTDVAWLYITDSPSYESLSTYMPQMLSALE